MCSVLHGCPGTGRKQKPSPVQIRALVAGDKSDQPWKETYGNTTACASPLKLELDAFTF